MKDIRVIIKKAGEPPVEATVPNCYETLKNTVEGYIEAVRFEKGVVCWINEEGKLIDLPHNFSINGISIEGNVIFTGETRGGNNKSLTDDQVNYIKALFSKKPTFYQKYIDSFFSEKDVPFMAWTYTKEGDPFIIRTIDTKTAIAFLRDVPDDMPELQESVMDQLTKLDFMNGNIVDFLKYVADFMWNNTEDIQLSV